MRPPGRVGGQLRGQISSVGVGVEQLVDERRHKLDKRRPQRLFVRILGANSAGRCGRLGVASSGTLSLLPAPVR
jgi:hypothetical protein